MGSIFKWLAGLVGTVIAGVAVYYFTLQPSPPVAQRANTVIVQYDKLGGPFLRIGPNVDGYFASPPLAERQARWHKFTVVISNECSSGRFNINASDMTLSLSPTTEFDGVIRVRPTTTALEHQLNRLQSTWLAPGESAQGELIFKVWDHEYDTDPNRMYPFIRMGDISPCRVVYWPR